MNKDDCAAGVVVALFVISLIAVAQHIFEVYL